jgi:hypothetical protein
MRIEEIKQGDVLVSVDQNGASYYRVLKVYRVMIKVRGENGNELRAYPVHFSRKITYPVNV